MTYCYLILGRLLAVFENCCIGEVFQQSQYTVLQELHDIGEVFEQSKYTLWYSSYLGKSFGSLSIQNIVLWIPDIGEVF